MRIFRCVAEHASFTRAAEQLELPRASVSSAVQELEALAGVRLLLRTTRRVSLSQEGAVYLTHCVKLLDNLEEVDDLFAKGRPEGRVCVNLPARLARMAVIPRLPGLLAHYPDIRVHVAVTDRLVDPTAEGVDCLVRVGPLRDSRLVARKVGELEQLNAASPQYLDRHGRPRRLEDLQNHYAVGYLSLRTGRVLDWEYLKAGREHTVKMRHLVTVDNTDAYEAAYLAGLGLIQAPWSGMEAHFEQNSLEEVLPKWRPAPLPVSVVYGQAGRLAPRVRVVVDWLVDALAL